VPERSGADVSAGHRVDLDTERRRAAQLARQVGRDDRPELDHGIVALVLPRLGELVVDESRVRHEAGATTAAVPLRSLRPT
jgi:hypothetical protein